MNCSQVAKFLPLYAGHDLSARRESLIMAHLQTCAVCSGAAAEYQDARNLTHHFTPPAFGDEVYAEIRQSVWQHIEAESGFQSRFEALAAWFQPRFAWAAAAALLVTLSVVGLYFLSQRFTVRPGVIAKAPKALEPVNRPGEKTGDDFSDPKGTRETHQADMAGRKRKPGRRLALDRGNSSVAYSPGAQLTKPENSSPVRRGDDLAAGDAERTLRMEIQTRNPKIRIIWFARDTKPAAVHSKGI